MREPTDQNILNAARHFSIAIAYDERADRGDVLLMSLISSLTDLAGDDLKAPDRGSVGFIGFLAGLLLSAHKPAVAGGVLETLMMDQGRIEALASEVATGVVAGWEAYQEVEAAS